MPDAGVSGNRLPATGRCVTAAAASAPFSHHISELCHQSSSNAVESSVNVVKSPVLAEIAHGPTLQPVYEIPYLQYH